MEAMRRVADRWFWGLWAAWTLAHVVWQVKAPDDYARIWGGMMRGRGPGLLLWTVVLIPIFATGFALFVAQMWRNYRAGRDLLDEADQWWKNRRIR